MESGRKAEKEEKSGGKRGMCVRRGEKRESRGNAEETRAKLWKAVESGEKQRKAKKS